MPAYEGIRAGVRGVTEPRYEGVLLSGYEAGTRGY